ncbi:MAG: DUF2087 domain-containing protein [Deltaproteobacteria bacterium]|nr:DUF2087 domain-containing protein [Deltaproteobacteria bacterium]
MKLEQSLIIIKALADQSRLSIVHSLLERPQYAEEIAKRHALAPSTVSFHLRKLEKAGLVSTRKEQYYVVIEANTRMFDTTLREIVSAVPAGKEVQVQRMEEYKRKVLGSFFRHGRLEKLPAQHKKRRIVLEQFSLLFQSERRYSEEEVTAIIKPLFDDYCTIRRLLVDEKLIRRDGLTYWREQGVGAQESQLSEPITARDEVRNMEKNRRAEIKREYKQNVPEMGIYQLRNKVNGKLYVDSTTNLEGTRSSRLFQLRMGKIVFNREMQKDLNEFGAENFEFSILEVLGKPSQGIDIERALAKLEMHWLEKLRPFGKHGYNSEKAYRRSLGQLGNFIGGKPADQGPL